MVKKGAKAKLIPTSKKATAKKKPAKKVTVASQKSDMQNRLAEIEPHVIEGKKYVFAAEFAYVTGMGSSGVRKKRMRGELTCITRPGTKIVSILHSDLVECVGELEAGPRVGRPICGYKKD